MTDMMKLTDALRSRAEYLKAGKEYYATTADGDMMYSAAVYIERLERDKSRLVEELAAVTRARDLEIRCRLDNAHLLTEAGEKIDGLQRDKTAMRNDLRAKCDALAEALSRERLRNVTKPRHYVESHVARLDRMTRRTWNVRDNTQSIAFAGTWTHKAVAHADTLELANRICAMLNESADSKL